MSARRVVIITTILVIALSLVVLTAMAASSGPDEVARDQARIQEEHSSPSSTYLESPVYTLAERHDHPSETAVKTTVDGALLAYHRFQSRSERPEYRSYTNALKGGAGSWNPGSGLLSPQSLHSSTIDFNPLSGGDECFYPETIHTFCFWAESISSDFTWPYQEFMRFPGGWNISNIVDIGPTVCDKGGSFGELTWSHYFGALNEVSIDQYREHDETGDSCYTNLCLTATTGAVAEDAAVSWYWYSDQYGGQPWFPCSSDGYTPTGKPACDESLYPPAVVPVCYIPPPLWQKWIDGQEWSDPTSLSVELGDTFLVVDTFNTPEGFMLEENWVDGRISLLDVVVTPTNIVAPVSGTGYLTLDVPPNVVETFTITKTFQVLPSTWVSTLLQENLSMGGQLVEQRPVSIYKQPPDLWVGNEYNAEITSGNLAQYTTTFGNNGGYENDVVIRSDFPPVATFFSATVPPDRMGSSGLWAEWDTGDLAKFDSGLLEVTVAARAGQPISAFIQITNTILDHTHLGHADSSTVTYQVTATTPLWQKTVNGQEWNPSLVAAVETADVVEVVDTVHGLQPMLLQDNWNSSLLSLINWTVEPEDIVLVAEGDGSLEMEVPGGYPGPITLHKYYSIEPSTWTSTTIAEDLYWDGQILASRPVTISKTAPELDIFAPGLIEVTSPAWTSYTISYTNNGGYENDVILSADFPPEVAYEFSSPAASWVSGDFRTAEWHLGDLANQSAGLITVTVSVSPNLEVSTSLPIGHALLNHLGASADSATSTLHVSETLPLWEKWINNQPWTLPFTHTAETYDTFQVVDVFNTLLPGSHQETWDPSRLQLLEVTVWPEGVAIPQQGAGFLNLDIPAGDPITIEVTKLFLVLPCTWTVTTITETFSLEGSTPITRQVRVNKTPPELTISHQHDPQAGPGSLVSYTLSFSNTGGYENNVLITATFPTEASYQSASALPDWVAQDNHQVRWLAGDLANGDSAQIVVYGVITTEIPRSTVIAVENEIADHTMTPVDGSAVIFEVIVPNYPPVGVADSYTTTEDVTLAITKPGVLANDSDANGDMLTAVLLLEPEHGQLALDADGSFAYTPTGNYAGPDHFQYLAFDGLTGSEPVSVTLSITPVNDLPVAGNDFYTTTEDGPLAIASPGLLANDEDVDGITLTAVLVDQPVSGELILSPDGSFVYTPTQDYFGADIFTYQAWDGLGGSNVAEVQLEIEPVNDPPVACADIYTGTENTVLTVNWPGVLGNDIDVDSAVLEALLVQPPVNGDLLLNLDGSFVFTPALGYSGQLTFTYQAADLLEQSATVPVTITILSTNEPPIAQGDIYSVTEDGLLVVQTPGVLANDSDPDGNPISAYLDSYPGDGILFFFPNGAFEYRPDQDVNGLDNFTYHINDGSADSAVVTVTIEILPVNDPPLAVTDVYTTNEDSPLVITAPGLLANDLDVDSAILQVIQDSEAIHGKVVLLEDGSFVYTPTANYFGPDSFMYHAFDGQDYSESVAVLLYITSDNDPPVGLSDIFTLTAGLPFTVTAPGVLANDSDVDGDILAAIIMDQPLSGSVVLYPDGGFVYIPEEGFVGADHFSYIASDGVLNSPPVIVNLVVLAEVKFEIFLPLVLVAP